MAFDQAKYEAALAMELKKRGLDPSAIPTATPSPVAGGESSGSSGAAIFPGFALGAKKGLAMLAKKSAPAIKELLGFGGSQGGAAAVELPAMPGASTMLPELTPMLPGAEGAAAASGSAAAGSSALSAGPQATTILGSTWTGPLAVYATAPMWAPPVAKALTKASQSILGKPSPARSFNLEELLAPNNSAEAGSSFWNKRFLDSQVPGYGGMANEQKSNFLQAANDLGGINKLVLYGEGDPETGQTTKRIGEGLRDDVAKWLQHKAQTGEELKGRKGAWGQYANYSSGYLDKLRALAATLTPSVVLPQTSGSASVLSSGGRSKTSSPGIGLDGKRIKY